MSQMVPELFSLDGRTALVTGAGGYLGQAIASGLAAAGAHVLLNARRTEPLAELAASIRRDGRNATVKAFDVTDSAAVEAALADVERLDVIVNNAYAGTTGTIDSSTVNDFLDACRISVAAANEVIRLARPQLRRAADANAGGASIINIASMYGMVSPDGSIYGNSGQNNPPHYGAAKAALIQWTRYAACHLAAERIRVNSISPGPFPRPEVETQNRSFIETLKRKTPLGRIGLPAELIGAVVFLASDASSYVTGANLPVDGGWTAW